MEAIKYVKETVRHLMMALFLQGLAFIILSVLIFMYPVLLNVLVATMLLLLGLGLLAMAYKVRVFWQKVPKFLK